MKSSRLPIILSLIFVGLMSRLLPHPPNVTAISAIAWLGTLYLGHLGLSLAVLFSVMFITDCVLGFHTTLLFVYGSMLFMVLFIHSKRHSTRDQKAQNLFLSYLLSSFVFFIVTNLGSWWFNVLYPKTVHGLALCYLAALPFLGNQFFGDLFYGVILFFSLFFYEKSLFLKNKIACP